MLYAAFFFLLLAGVSYGRGKTPEEILTENDYIYQPLGYYMYVYFSLCYIFFCSNKNGADYSCYPYEVILDHSSTFQVYILLYCFVFYIVV